jgi:hypothetical protein
MGVVPHFFMRGKDPDIEKLKRGGCYEREKQRGKGRQEGATEKPQREEKDEEGEEEQVGRTASMMRGQIYFFRVGDGVESLSLALLIEIGFIHKEVGPP